MRGRILLLAIVIFAIFAGGMATVTVLNIGTSEKADTAEQRAAETKRLQVQLHRHLVAACRSPEGVTQITRRSLQRELAASAAVDYSLLFPNYPQEELNRLLRESNDGTKDDIAALSPKRCKLILPSPE